jgi:hypothetical protein
VAAVVLLSAVETALDVSEVTLSTVAATEMLLVAEEEDTLDVTSPLDEEGTALAEPRLVAAASKTVLDEEEPNKNELSAPPFSGGALLTKGSKSASL